MERVADRIRRILSDTRDRMICAADGPELFGYIHLSPYELLYCDPLINILALVVRSDCRGQGVGKALIRAAENFAREEGYAGIRLVSGFDRTQAHGFYEAQGFTLRKEQKNYIKHLQ
jgi:ribosomal protein S18 acetylase RimI-like enzyme